MNFVFVTGKFLVYTFHHSGAQSTAHKKTNVSGYGHRSCWIFLGPDVWDPSSYRRHDQAFRLDRRGTRHLHMGLQLSLILERMGRGPHPPTRTSNRTASNDLGTGLHCQWRPS